MTPDSSVYFANLPPDQIASALMERAKQFYEFMKNAGLYNLALRSARAWAGLPTSGRGGGRSTALVRGGKQGELTLVGVNHYRNFGTHMLNQLTSETPVWKAIAVNSDTESTRRTILTGNLLDYYYREGLLEEHLLKTARHMLKLSEGWTEKAWDSTLGEVERLDENKQPIKNGDFRFSSLSPMDVIRDVTCGDMKNSQWLTTRKLLNKWDLAARYSEFADRISAMTPRNDSDEPRFQLYGLRDSIQGSDFIPVYEFFHRKSDAVPDGKQVLYLDGELVLFEGPLAGDEIPVYQLVAEEHDGLPFGRSVMYDILGLQELLNALYSIVATNQTTFGVQLITALKGHGVSYKQLAQGLALVEYTVKDGRPEPMNFTMSPKEIILFIDKLESAMETISGINSVVRGNPEGALKSNSGAALALLSAEAMQFSSSGLKAFRAHMCRVGMGMVKDLRRNITSPRQAKLAGKMNKSYLLAFSGSDLEGIERVQVELANPVSSTTAGKMNLADRLLDRDMLTAEQYIELATTGTHTPTTESALSTRDRIRGENEFLANGQPQRALITDPHWMEIPEHMVVLDSAEARADPNSLTVQLVLAHVQEHIAFWRTMDPALIVARGGIPPPPPLPPDMAMVPPPAGGGGGGAPPAAAPAQPPQENKSKPGQAAMPNQPKNPATGESWDPSTGGGMVAAL